jgi:predicted acetyltransferase
MRLLKASLQPPDDLDAFLAELGSGENGFGGTDYSMGQESLEAFLRRLIERESALNLPDGVVPSTTFWLVDDDGQVLGMTRLRHHLNEGLRIHGGHIGYYVRPSARGRGCGTAILSLCLAEARSLGIERVMLTVDSDNEPSIRVIEGNGGVMEDELPRPETGRPYRRYWIG